MVFDCIMRLNKQCLWSLEVCKKDLKEINLQDFRIMKIDSIINSNNKVNERTFKELTIRKVPCNRIR